jgi:DMSO/TMAO reductase YedYZ molybdopterin-dependent catalytic subunit
MLTLVVVGVFLGPWLYTNLFTSNNTPPPGEITEYNGQKLNSIKDFRIEAITGVQQIDNTTYRLTVNGLVTNQTIFTYNEVIDKHAHYQKVVILHCVEGWEVKALWEGVLVKDLLQDAGFNDSAQIVIFHCQDGYTTSLPLSFVVNNNLMIAYKVNGLVLPQSEGFPFRLVAEGKLGYKWAKWITSIEVSDNVNFRGYWESYGYDNSADWP